MSTKKVETSNKLVQTTIHCFPYILLSDTDPVSVVCDRGVQTAISETPTDTKTKFYSLLEFLPYQVIAEGALKEFDLPRKALLQWNLPCPGQQSFTALSFSSVSQGPETEESELSRLQKGVLKKSASNSTDKASFGRFTPHHNTTMQKSVVSQEVQTQLSVWPHVLDTDEVANVFTELSIQTSITCVPNDSISNILPQLKANLSHLSTPEETKEALQKTPKLPAEVQEGVRQEDEEVEIDGQSSEETNQQAEEGGDAVKSVGSNEDLDESLVREPSLNPIVSGPTDAQAVSITLSSHRGCNCGSKMLNQIAKQLRVQASTLQLAPKVFPPGEMFEGKIMEVLNMTIAVLQTEMANMMEIYVGESEPCGCSEKSTQIDPRLCSCTEKHDAVPGGQKEIKTITCTRQTIDPQTNKPNLVKEDITEEITKTITVNSNNETVVEEKIRTTTVREKISKLSDDKIESSKSKVSCKCVKTSEAEPQEIILPVDETSTSDSNATAEEEPDIAPSENAPPAEDTVQEETFEGEKEELSPSVDDAINEEHIEGVPEESAEPEGIAALPGPSVTFSELVGDFKENKHENFIPCECHPTEAGAAPTICLTEPAEPLELQEPLEPAEAQELLEPLQPQLDEVLDGSVRDNSLPETETDTQPDVAHASATLDEEPSMVTNAPSLAEEAVVIENVLKFDIILKKGVKDVESASVTSAIVVSATISCPNANTNSKPTNKPVKASLPNLNEQVIRLSVKYKNAPTEPETLMEELLTPGRQIKIAPNKLPVSPSNVSIPIKNTDGKGCECGKLVCARQPSKMQKSYNTADDSKVLPITSKVGNTSMSTCPCGKEGGFQSQAVQNEQFRNLPIEIEEIPFSTMPCPVHQQTPRPIPTCPPRSTPSSRPPISNALPPSTLNPPKALNTPRSGTEMEITVSFGVTDQEDVRSVVSFMYEHDADYDEPYVEELFEIADLSAAVQTDLSLGDQLQSESLNSLVLPEKGEDGEAVKCSSKTEMPWQKISLPPPGSYSIKPVSKPVVTTEPASSRKQTATEVEAPIVPDVVENNDVLNEVVEEGGDEDDEEDDVDGSDVETVEEGTEEGGEKGVEELEEEDEEIGEEDEEIGEEEGKEEGGEERGYEGGEGDVEGEEQVGPTTERESVAKSGPRLRKEPLIFESEGLKHNEPYMEGLYRAYPNSDDEQDGACDSHTEMPWKDILLPENCTIRKMKKTKKCTCKSEPENVSGMFIPTTKPPRYLEDEEDDFIEINFELDDTPSVYIPVEELQSSVPEVVSTISNILAQPRRCPKEYIFSKDFGKDNNLGVLFQAGESELHRKSTDLPLTKQLSLPFSVTTHQETQDTVPSVIINTDPPTEYPPSLTRIPGTESAEMRVIEPSTYAGGVIAATRSCETTNSKTVDVIASTKNVSSMPTIPSQKSVKATVSLKKVGQPDKVVSQVMDLVPGDNVMTLQVPDAPISVKLKMSTPLIAPTPTPTPILKPTPSAPITPPTVSTTPIPPSTELEVFSPAKCPCKDKVKLNTFKQDPVMAALEAYEAEMKPLRQALTQLQQKIRNLNMPEMKGCMCRTAPYGQQAPTQQAGAFPSTAHNRVQALGVSNVTPKTTMAIRPDATAGSQFGRPQGTCPFYRPAAYGPPPPPPLMYGRLPPPMVPPRHQPYMAAAPNYNVPPNTSRHQHQRKCSIGRSSMSRESKQCGRRESVEEERRCKRDQGRYPREDLATQARHNGMYPDYRGRQYPDEQMAYRDSCRSTHGKNRNSPKKYKVRNVVSVQSSGNATSDYSGYDSQGASDGEDLCPLVVQRRVSSEKSKSRCGSHHSKQLISVTPKRGQKDSSCRPCRDHYGQELRPGQAMKTNPDEFLPTSSRSLKCRSGVCDKSTSGNNMATPKATSKQRIQIKFPYR